VSTRLRSSSEAACEAILEPLVVLLLHAGVAVSDLADICKRLYVRVAAADIRKSSTRLNQSRIAIVTGLTRAEVKRLLLPRKPGTVRFDWQLDRATRVLNGWKQDREFRHASGKPKDLPKLGKRGSFQVLVRRYSGDIPLTAMRKELLKAGAIRVLQNGAIRMQSTSSTRKAARTRDLVAFAEKGRDYLFALAQNVLDPQSPAIEESVRVDHIPIELLPLLRKTVASRSKVFISALEEQLRSAANTRKDSRRAGRVKFGVTVFAVEDSERRRS
jgi:hypothetical protein